MICILYIFWIGYPFYEYKFSNMENLKNPIQIFNLIFS